MDNATTKITTSELKCMSDSACEILVLIRLMSNNSEMDSTDMQYALSGITKLAHDHNGKLFDLVRGVSDND